MAKILIVDDEPGVLDVLSRLLSSCKHDVTKVRDSGKAKKLIDSKRKEYDLAVFDIRMAPIDGMELLAHTREQRPDLKVIMLSAHYAGDLKERATSMGAYACVGKPFSVDGLLDTIEAAVAPAA